MFFRLKDGIEFHLFITTAPCGDARIFSLHESPSSSSNLGASGSNSNSVTNLNTNVIGNLKEEKREDPGRRESPGREEVVADKEDAGDEEKDHLEMKLCSEGGEDGEQHKQHEGGESVLKEVPEDPSKDEKNQEGEKANGATSGISNINRKREQLPPQQDSSRGMLRSKIECGMGTVPINPKILVQTWDGVMSGDRLLTMACSDKILRWNVLGMQGALLTHLIKPVYLKSVTVGSKFHPGHMKRALYERILPSISDLPAGYIVNMPDLCATTSPETR